VWGYQHRMTGSPGNNGWEGGSPPKETLFRSRRWPKGVSPGGKGWGVLGMGKVGG